MISKELLCELGYGKVTHIGNVVGLYNMDCLRFECERIISSGRSDGKFIITNTTFHIAIEVLAYKCKVWALNKGYRLLSGFDEKEYENSPDIEYSCIVNHIYCEGGCRSDNNFNSYSEPEAIFKATSYIMEQLKQKD